MKVILGSRGATAFLADLLANGPVPAKLIEERAAAHGISKTRLRRVKRKIGAETYKERKFQGAWFWRLAAHSAPKAA